MAEPTLYARMELRLTDFEKKLAKATKATDTTMRKIEARGDQLTTRMKGIGTGAFGGLLKGAALTLAPILSVTAALGGARDALDRFSAIADDAKSSGLDAETYQALAYQAEQSGVAFDEFSGALNTFAKNSGLAVENKGRMVTALKALNPELLANIQAATNQEQRVRLAAEAIAAAGSASEKAALSTALFGDAGFRMADAFSGGTAAMDAMATKARALGLIIDRDLIARSEALGDELSTATQVMDLEFKSALVSLAPVLIATAQLAGNLASAVNYLTQSMQSLQDRSTARLEQDYKGLTDTLAQSNAEYAPGVVGNMGVQIDPTKQAEMQSQADALRAELKRRAIAKLAADLNQPKVQPYEAPEASGDGGNAAAKSAIAHGEAVKKLVADLQFEKQILRETVLEQQILNTLRNAGVAATSAESIAIRSLVTDLETQKSAIQANADAMAEFGSMANDAMGSFIDYLVEGKSLAESFGNVLGQIGKQLLQQGLASLTGSSGLGSLFGSIPGRATGGPVQAGQPYIVGEKRAELFVPSSAGRIVPRVPIPGPVKRSAGGSGAINVNFAPVIDATGADAAGLARVQGQLAQMRAELPSVIKRTVQRRGKEMW